MNADTDMGEKKGQDSETAGAPEAPPQSQPVRQVKRSPNRLIVDESHGEGDNSCVMLSLAKMEGGAFPCDVFFLLLSSSPPPPPP